MPQENATQNQDPNQIQEISDIDMQALWAAEVAKRAGKTPDPAFVDPATAVAADDKPTEPAATDKPADKPAEGEPKPDQTAAKDEDPFEKRFASLEQELKRTAGRVSAVQSELAKAATRATQSVNDAPSQGQQAAALKNPEKWNALKKEFPEWGEAIDEVLSANLAQAKLDPAVLEQAVESRVEQRLQARESARIERKHPGWAETVKTDEFKAWRATQPPEVNALGASDFAEDAIELLDLFAKRNEKPAEKTEPTRDIQAERAARLATAATTPRAPRAVVTPRSDSELSPQEIWRQEARKRAERKAQQAAAAF